MSESSAKRPVNRAHQSQRCRRGASGVVRLWLRLAVRENVGQLLDVVTCDQYLAAVVLLAQAVDELRAKDVDLAVQDAPLVGDLSLFLCQLADDVFQFDIRERAKVGKRLVHRGASPHTRLGRPRPLLQWADRSAQYRSKGQAELEAAERISRTPVCRYSAVAMSASARPTNSITSPAPSRPTIAKKNEPITGATAIRPGQLIFRSTPRRSP